MSEACEKALTNEYLVVFRNGIEVTLPAINIATALEQQLAHTIDNPVDKIIMLSNHPAAEVPCYDIMVTSIEDLNADMAAQFIRLEMPVLATVEYQENGINSYDLELYWDGNDIPQPCETFVVSGDYGPGQMALASGSRDAMEACAQNWCTRQRKLYPGLNISPGSL